jgi:hypothetical protein
MKPDPTIELCHLGGTMTLTAIGDRGERINVPMTFSQIDSLQAALGQLKASAMEYYLRKLSKGT